MKYTVSILALLLLISCSGKKKAKILDLNPVIMLVKYKKEATL